MDPFILDLIRDGGTRGLRQEADAPPEQQAGASVPSSPVGSPRRKPPTWNEVLEMPEMRTLPSDQLEAARNQYFADVIMPAVPTAHSDAARAAFDAASKPAEPRPAQLLDAGELERPARMTLTRAGQPRYEERLGPTAQTGLEEPPEPRTKLFENRSAFPYDQPIALDEFYDNVAKAKRRNEEILERRDLNPKEQWLLIQENNGRIRQMARELLRQERNEKIREKQRKD